jgi:hypothetical protein
MYTVIRTYTGNPGIADEFKKHTKDIESLINTVPGFVAYYMIKTADGAASITVCEDRTGCDESTKRAATYIRENLSNLKINPPQITSGEVAFKFVSYAGKV